MTSLVCANLSPIPILVYHQIDVAPPKGAPFRSLYVAPAAFARQMRFLSVLGYRGLSMSALLPYVRGEKQGKVVGITFDDGYVNNLQHALPVLQAQGFSSTCYAVSQRLGQTNVWDAEVGVSPTPLMDAAQLRQWVAGGQEVGAHTRHHVNLKACDEALALEEISLSKKELSTLTGRVIEAFSYPYGWLLEKHTEMVKLAGFKSATTTVRGRVRAGLDLLQLPRVPVVHSTTLPVFWLKLATGYEDRRAA
ncbi:MAG: polysaccharide deacetylase [Comamonadaceae bacterium CG1_02_60_18]|nr:MAG: polysaccharide deacetylase [Comamonadaceae bacterium CG1_02_60_18]PIQ51456.1 MAG: polysaccharide deacetylase [Comamonadaceae bacterium CG12_big_fil_rev_8_21_14_0_65_59_15]